MNAETGKHGESRGRSGKVAAGAVLLVAGLVAAASFPVLPRLSAPDIHTEYIKFPSGRDTITAYLAYPERKDPAPAVVVLSSVRR